MSELMKAVEAVITSVKEMEDVPEGYVLVSVSAFMWLSQVYGEHKYQVAKCQDRRFIQLKQCLILWATTKEKKKTTIVVEPGDKGRVIGYTKNGEHIIAESLDPGKAQFTLPVVQERRVWEWISE